MNQSEAKETAVYQFENALDASNLVDQYSSEDLPKYYRGYVPDEELTNDSGIWVLYNYQDIESTYCDNEVVTSQIYIVCRVLCRNGFSDSDFQDIKQKIETNLIEREFIVNWGEEGVDTTISADTPIYYSKLTAIIRL